MASDLEGRAKPIRQSTSKELPGAEEGGEEKEGAVAGLPSGWLLYEGEKMDLAMNSARRRGIQMRPGGAKDSQRGSETWPKPTPPGSDPALAELGCDVMDRSVVVEG